MAANVLSSPLAITMSVYVVRAFVKLRDVLAGDRQLTQKLEEIERKLTIRHEVHERAIVQLFRHIRQLTDSTPAEKARQQIGFRTKKAGK